MDCTRDEVLQVRHGVAFSLGRNRSVVEWRGRILRDVGRFHVLLYEMRENLHDPCLSTHQYASSYCTRTSLRASFDGGFRCTSSLNIWEAFSRGCNDACDSAAARMITPLAFGAADRADEPNSARKSSVTCRVWNESAC